MIHGTATYVRYDVKLPNRTLLRILSGVGITLVLAGFVLSVIGLIQTLLRPYNYSQYYYLDVREYTEPGLTIEWYYGIIVVAIGFIIHGRASSTFEKYYRVVRQGRVVSKDTGGGGIFGLTWYVTIEGNTLANERRRYTIPVSAGFWQQATTRTRVYDY